MLLLAFSLLLVSCKEQGKAPVAVAPKIPVAPYAVFAEGLIDDITPEGWVREILQRQKDGLTGHPEAMSYPFDSCCWAGNLEMSKNPHYWGSDWWRFEQSAYYVDGFTRLSAAEVIQRYDLHSSANVKRVKDALMKKEILLFDANDVPSFQDPLFEYWLSSSYFRTSGVYKF